MAKVSGKISPIPLGINWHEGMLLSQHHFQQNDLRNFHVLTHQIKLLSSNHFGVCHLRTDQVALTDGIYRINEIEAIFPDGLIFSFFPQKYKGLKPLEINMAQYMSKESSEATIYLILAESSEDISPILGNPARYYTLDGDIVADDNIKDNTARIPRLFPNALLHVSDSIPEFYTGFPLCKIIKTDGVFHVKNWTPPCFFIEKHYPLWKRCAILTVSIREKAAFLCEKLKNASGSTVAYDTEKILSQLITILPGLEALIYSDEIRPYELYKNLAAALGAVATLIPTDMMPVMQPYNHNDIDGCLYPVINLIEHYVSTVERGFALIAFNKKDKFFYHYMTSDNIEQCYSGKIYIGIRGDFRTESSYIEKWIKDAIIVSDFAVEDVRVKRIKGAERKPLKQEVIAQILPGAGIMLFEIDIDPNFIKGEQNLHVFNPGASSEMQPTEIIMYIPREKVK